MKESLSVLVITKNEATNIARCLESVAWADEIIVVDAESTDDTCAIARRYTDRVVVHQWLGYSGQKNYGHSLATHTWILSIDADERVPQTLREEITGVLSNTEKLARVVAFRIPIRDWMFGKFVEYGSWPRQRHIRLYRKDSVRWKGSVHEGQEVSGYIDGLTSPLLHYSHTSVRRFIDKLNAYTELEAQEYYAQGRHANLALALFGALRAFFGQYVRLQGFRDGGHGLILAVLMAVYYFVTQAKLWTYWYSQGSADRP